MRTIGLIGGLSWQSTQTYYRIINTGVNQRLGGNHSAKILMYSFNFEEIENLQCRYEWDTLNNLMSRAGRMLEGAAADCILICSNTMHESAPYLEQVTKIPLIHIVDAVGEALYRQKIRKAGLLGTKFLMQSTFYIQKLKEVYDIETTIPNKVQIEEINTIIYAELVKGVIKKDSRDNILRIIRDMAEKGIEAIILGCTEIPLLISQRECELPVLDTTQLHALKAVEFALCDPIGDK